MSQAPHPLTFHVSRLLKGCVIFVEGKRIFHGNRTSETQRCSPLSHRMENDIMREGRKIRTATFGLLCLAALTTGACVMPSTYNEAVADLHATKAELDRTRTQSQGLTEQVRGLEEHKVVLARQMEATSSVLQEATQQMEAERNVSQERLSKLNRLVSQLTAQQHNLRQALQRAKEEQVPLRTSVDRYKANLGETEGLRASLFPPPSALANETVETALAPPAPAPVPQDPVPNPALPTPADPTATHQKAPAVKQPSGPVEEGWRSTLKGWVVSLWQSIFS